MPKTKNRILIKDTAGSFTPLIHSHSLRRHYPDQVPRVAPVSGNSQPFGSPSMLIVCHITAGSCCCQRIFVYSDGLVNKESNSLQSEKIFTAKARRTRRTAKKWIWLNFKIYSIFFATSPRGAYFWLRLRGEKGLVPACSG